MSLCLAQQQTATMYRSKPDLRLAESYIPALVLGIKCMAYTLIAPIILLLPWKVTVLAMAAFGLVLYVDHLYLVPPHQMAFIDTTAVSLDVLGATLLVLGMSLLRPCSQQCQAILGIWTLCGGAYFFVTPQQNVPRGLVHSTVLVLVLCFIYADIGMAGPVSLPPSITNSSTTSPPFFYRTALYLSLSLVDIYLFRPLFQQENERLLFCKYGPVLLGAWPWCLLFWALLCTAQLLKHLTFHHQLTNSAAQPDAAPLAGQHHTLNIPSASSIPSQPSCSKVQELDLMEAFRLAKQQHMGAKCAL